MRKGKKQGVILYPVKYENFLIVTVYKMPINTISIIADKYFILKIFLLISIKG